MKQTLYLVAAVLLALGLAGGVASWVAWRQSPIAEYNRLIDQGKKGLLGGNPAGAQRSLGRVLDSLMISDERVSLNFAHAGFAVRLEKGMDDTTQRYALDTVMAVYQALAASPQKTMASLAQNQLGNATVKFTPPDPAQWESALQEAITHYQNALRQDPTNDSIRYNYELLQRVFNFPNEVLATVDRLVSQRQYGLAYRFLAVSRKRDPRLNAQADMEQRLKAIYEIDQQP
ncbi:MAG: tetratricopeptide repeat protein [Cyclobacteriaceae bacterium]|jgi:hypothetical protein|nr:tetratricopeptide repeat protein [Cyclobacteriaceae bacterium]